LGEFSVALKKKDIKHYTLGKKSAIFIGFKNEILRAYVLRMTGKG
jgi:hypothetical protein